MKILVTAGSTQCPIDNVRAITNIFRGNTGVNIAYEAAQRGHNVTLLGSPSAYDRMMNLAGTLGHQAPTSIKFRTYDDLAFQLESHMSESWDAVVQSAAVSDYKVAGVFESPENLYRLLRQTGSFTPQLPEGKISSKLDEIFLHLVPTIKLVDKIREWGLGDGILVKFKLEVDITQEELLQRAFRSQADSDADIMVANRLNDFQDWQTPSIELMDRDGQYVTVSREELPTKLLDLMETKDQLLPTAGLQPARTL